jgi:hypothetical protein
MATNSFFYIKDRTGSETEIPIFPDHVDHLEYGGAASKNITLPANTSYIFVTTNSTSVNYAVKLGTGAAIGTVDIVDGTGNVLNLSKFAVPNGTTQISIAASGAVKITLAYYKHAA